MGESIKKKEQEVWFEWLKPIVRMILLCQAPLVKLTPLSFSIDFKVSNPLSFILTIELFKKKKKGFIVVTYNRMVKIDLGYLDIRRSFST